MNNNVAIDDAIFRHLERAAAEGGTRAALDALVDALRVAGREHELFEALKFRIRAELGLPLAPRDLDETLEPSIRDRLDQGLIAACQEVGQRLMDAGRLRESWTYLRVLGDRQAAQQALARAAVRDDSVGELIELCIHEQLDLARGFRLLLEHYGTCNAITTFNSSMYGHPRQRRAIGAEILVRHLHDELLTNVREHFRRQTGDAPQGDRLAALLSQHPSLVADGTYHIDTTHLASVVRIARDLDAMDALELAHDLTAYGHQLDASLQFPGDPPFEDLYATSARMFAALQNIDRAEHLSFFRERAEAVDAHQETTAVIEVYLDLLARCGQAAKAFAESQRLIPEGISTTGLAPTLWELAQAAGDYQAWCQRCRQRRDPLGYALGLLSGPPS
jgi:hypothetical protein